MPVLLALFGPQRGVRLEIDEAAVLGRSSDADLQLVDGKVSREHCKLIVDGRSLRIEDLGSQNGTWVNGERLSAARKLQPGDEIAVGDSLFVVDGDLDVAAARFGDATLAVGPGGPSPEAVGAGKVGKPAAARPAAATALASVAQLAAALQSAPDLENAARAVLAAIEEALAPARAFVFLWDALSGTPRPLVGKADGAVVSVSRTVLEMAARLKRGVAVEDAVEDRDLRRARSVVKHQIRSVAVAPLLVGEAVAGFLHADRTSPPYTASDAAALQAIARVFALHPTIRPAIPPPPPRRSDADGKKGAKTDEAPAPIAASAAMKEALRICEKVAASTSTVLCTGESGTGKEEIARTLHARSPRAGGPFVAVNCGAIPASLAESEFFGHEKGAFTGAATARPGQVEAADGGTLFLDEIGELPLALQVKLLRVLQQRAFTRVGSTTPRRVDVRVVAATHRDLEAEMKAGRFREDLFYRLNVIRIHLPPLRERPDDVEPLARALLGRAAIVAGTRDPGLAADALPVLRRWPWPGNVRELSNVLERALVLRMPGQMDPLSAQDVAAALGEPPSTPPSAAGGTLPDKIAALERIEIESALRRCRGVKARAAQALGISRPTLDKKIADLGIDIWRDSGMPPVHAASRKGS